MAEAWELIACPDPDCTAPAEVRDRFELDSTDGPVVHVLTYCLAGHRFTPPDTRSP